MRTYVSPSDGHIEMLTPEFWVNVIESPSPNPNYWEHHYGSFSAFFWPDVSILVGHGSWYQEFDFPSVP